MAGVALAFLLPATTAAGCASDRECSLNGICQQNGSCACDPPWTGTACDRLVRLPAQPRGMYGYHAQGYWPNETAKTSSWGGNVLPSSGGGWDLFVAEIPAGLANWGHQSSCVHATAPSAQGPFTRTGVAMPQECHNPQVIRERVSGDYLLFHIGGGGSKSAVGIHSWVARSDRAEGPFSPLNTSGIGCNNPAPAYHPNGTLFVICNEMQLTSISPDGLARGAWTPLRPSGLDAPKPQDGRHYEDAHLWFDRRGNWHIVYHCYCLQPYAAHNECFSGHAFSTDGMGWTFSSTEPFGGTVQFMGSGHPPITFTTRERPKFLFKEGTNHSVPIGLITGVSASCSPPSEQCCSRCNRTTLGSYSAATCSQCKHGWQHCQDGRCWGGSKGGMDYTYTVFEPLEGYPEAT